MLRRYVKHNVQKQFWEHLLYENRETVAMAVELMTHFIPADFQLKGVPEVNLVLHALPRVQAAAAFSVATGCTTPVNPWTTSAQDLLAYASGRSPSLSCGTCHTAPPWQQAGRVQRTEG